MIRDAQEKDMKKILDIYRYYVEKTSITLEITVPTEETMIERFNKTKYNGYPYIVLEDDHNNLLGFAYAGVFHEREAYKYSCTISIYLSHDETSKGNGQLLYDNLEKCLKDKGFIQIISLISGDNKKSVKFHEKNGYKKIGHFKNSAIKFDKWHDLLWYNKTINSIDTVLNIL